MSEVLLGGPDRGRVEGQGPGISLAMKSLFVDPGRGRNEGTRTSSPGSED